MGCIVPLEWSDGFVELCGDWVCGEDRQIKGMKDTLFMRMRGESVDKVSGRWLVDKEIRSLFGEKFCFSNPGQEIERGVLVRREGFGYGLGPV